MTNAASGSEDYAIVVFRLRSDTRNNLAMK